MLPYQEISLRFGIDSKTLRSVGRNCYVSYAENRGHGNDWRIVLHRHRVLHFWCQDPSAPSNQNSQRMRRDQFINQNISKSITKQTDPTCSPAQLPSCPRGPVTPSQPQSRSSWHRQLQQRVRVRHGLRHRRMCRNLPISANTPLTHSFLRSIR